METSLHKTQRYLLPDTNGHRDAGNPPDIFPGREQPHPRGDLGFRDRDQSTQTLVCLPGHFDARDDLLADITPLVVVDRAAFQIGFRRDDLFSQLASPTGNPSFDPERFRGLFVEYDGLSREILQSGSITIALQPQIEAGATEALTLNSRGSGRKIRCVFTDDMKQCELFRHIVDLHIVGDDVMLQPGRELFAHPAVGIDQKRFTVSHDKHIGVNLSFSSQNAGVNRGRFGCFPQIVRDLSIQITEPIPSRGSELRAIC